MRQLTTQDGNVSLAQSFDPYGNPFSAMGPSDSNYGYAGEWTDATGLQFLRARYYAPGQGRFLTHDPFPGLPGQPATLNPYVYALNNPLLYTDPSGENPLLLVGILGGLLGGAIYGYGFQVIRNLNQGLCFWDALTTNIDAGQVALYAVVGTLIGTGIGGSMVGIKTLAIYLGIGNTIGTTLSADGDITDEFNYSIQLTQSAIQGIRNIPASIIRFTQSSISPITRAGIYLDDLAQEIDNGYFRGYIRVVEYEGKLYSLDNRRLAAFKLLDINVPVLIEDITNPLILEQFHGKLTTFTQGLSVIVRGANIIIR